MLSRAYGSDTGLAKQESTNARSLIGTKRVSYHARASRDPDEGQNHDPGQANRGIARQRLFKPASRPCVVRRVRVNRVDQDACIDKDHFRSSSLRAISSSSQGICQAQRLGQIDPRHYAT